MELPVPLPVKFEQLGPFISKSARPLGGPSYPRVREWAEGVAAEYRVVKHFAHGVCGGRISGDVTRCPRHGPEEAVDKPVDFSGFV